MTSEQIRLVEDEWYAKFNRTYNVNTNLTR